MSTVLAFQFLTKDKYVHRNQLLCNIAAQLLFRLRGITPDAIPTSMEPFLHINKDDSAAVENLIHVLLLEIPFTYIFVDGLDEAEYADDQAFIPTIRQNQEVPTFVDFLVREVLQSPTTVRVVRQSIPHVDSRVHVQA